jgi:hypothetical protein
MVGMASKKKPPAPPDARKPFKMVRVREVLAAAAEARAGQLVQDLTQYCNDAIRMRLEAEGHWPPPPPKPAK